MPPDLQVQYGGNCSQDALFLPSGSSYVVPDYEAIDGVLTPNFGTVNVVDNTGASKYNALQVSFRQNSPQFFAQVSYTLAKATDRGTGYYNQFDISAQRGGSALDQGHRLAASGGWTPTNGFVRNFIVSGVLTEATGRPYTGVLDTAQVNFSLVPGQGYNSFTGPGTNNFDLSLARDIHFKERYTLRLRAEAFDLFNHANYLDTVNNVQYATSQRSDESGNPVNVWDALPNPGFGTPLATFPEYGARNFQFSSRFSF